MLEKILLLLQGKKGSIATLIMGIIAYLATKGTIGEPEVALSTLVCLVLFGSASHFTGKLYK